LGIISVGFEVKLGIISVGFEVKNELWPSGISDAQSALGQAFSEYFGFLANLYSTNCSTVTLTYHLGLVQ
jgi:hypothetical protein